MVTSDETLEKIRKIIEKHYQKLLITVGGNSIFTPQELQQLKEAGVDTSNTESLLELIYHHNFKNAPSDSGKPTSIQDMKSQQNQPGVKAKGEAHDYAIKHINNQMKDLVEKLRSDVTARITSVITQNNENYRRNALQNLTRPAEMDRLVKESTLGDLKRALRDTSGDSNRDWKRVAITETSNTIGMASVDRIVADNQEKDLNDVYVYRIIVGDEATCKWCRRFYQDDDGSPKVYKLSTLLANGSNYGKPKDAWMAVSGATHPNTRTSQIVELKPGWKVLPGGGQSFIGMEKWNDYIVNKAIS